MKVLVTADWHLDANTAGYDRFADVAKSIDAMVDAAIRSKVDLFLFLGDLCDPDASRAPRCVAKAINAWRQLQQAGIASRWLVGNHDVIEDGSGTSTLTPLRAAGADVIEEPMTGTIGGVQFVWLPYVPRVRNYDAAEFVASVNLAPDLPVVVAGHLTVPVLDPGSETHDMPRGRDLVFPVEQVVAKWPKAMLLNGHYHTACWMIGQQVGGGLCVPGSLERLTFGEQGNVPGYSTLDPHNGAPIRSRFAHARPMRTYDTNHPVWSREEGRTSPQFESLDEFPAHRNSPGLAGALVRLRPPAGTTQEWIDAVADRLRTGGAVAVRVIPPPALPAVIVPGAPEAPPSEPRLRPRDVVERMVADAIGVDRAALHAIVQDVLGAEGL